MTLNDLVPAPLRGHGRRRAVDKVTELRAENVILLGNLHCAGDAIALLRQDLAEAHAKQGEAEELVVQQQADMEELTVERDEWRDRFLALQARFGTQIAAEENANRVDVPPMTRIGADQDTQSIDVTTLREAAEAGLLPGCGAGRLGPVTDPGRVHAEGVA
ncbi:hypothetical protein ABZT06_08725 [Streptomyces sp. NPDC005483]|uniref:hypothetical protein n=1 Tax=Streptomyces sp. NPDC005483 TaxID=3154882 RepID=UPI0033A59768